MTVSLDARSSTVFTCKSILACIIIYILKFYVDLFLFLKLPYFCLLALFFSKVSRIKCAVSVEKYTKQDFTAFLKDYFCEQSKKKNVQSIVNISEKDFVLGTIKVQWLYKTVTKIHFFSSMKLQLQQSFLLRTAWTVCKV